VPQAFPGLYSLYSHEYVHAWNVKRIRPTEMWPYDYDEWQPTPLLWVSEGITDYYGDLVLARTGLWAPDELWTSFAQAAQGVADEPPYSVEDSSLETWLDPIDVSSQFYYSKGKLLGFLLDAMIRDATDGASSLDDVMRRLFRERYQAGRGFTTDDVLDFVDDYVDAAEVRSFYERYVDGRDPLPYGEVLAKVGLAYRVETTMPPFLGIGAQAGPSGETVITDITPGSAAEAAGIQEGDVLLTVGEVQVVPDADWAATFRERYAGAEGAPLPIVVRRDGAAVTLQGTVRTRERTDVIIEPDPAAGERAQRLREGLLAR
jgi:predicted metalloprotease with PDZ domain